jgi:DNA uptake protein ComE-like DNA-binding protein
VVALVGEKERLIVEVAESEREMILWEKKARAAMQHKSTPHRLRAVRSLPPLRRARADSCVLPLTRTLAPRARRCSRAQVALERETQAALDPEVGATEVKAMQREIHRMKLRLSQLKKREELMLAEMERAIYKRDNIEAKGKTAAARTPGETQASLKKTVAELSKKLKLTTHDANMTAVNVQRLREQQTTVAADLDALNSTRRELLAQEESLHATIQTQEIERAFFETELHKNQRLAESLQHALAGGGPRESEAELRERLAEADDEIQVGRRTRAQVGPVSRVRATSPALTALLAIARAVRPPQLARVHSQQRAAEVVQMLAHAFPSFDNQLRAVMLPATVGSSLSSP